MSDYVSTVAHGKIYTASVTEAAKIRHYDSNALLVIPLKDNSWTKLVSNSKMVNNGSFSVRPELAPSKRLSSSYRNKLLGLYDFELTYNLEMEDEKCKTSIEGLACESLSGRTVIIFGTARRGQFCHRAMLAKIIAKAVVSLSTSRHRAKIKAYAGEWGT